MEIKWHKVYSFLFAGGESKSEWKKRRTEKRLEQMKIDVDEYFCLWYIMFGIFFFECQRQLNAVPVYIMVDL